MHQWKFNRISGLDQVELRNGSDLLNLKFLDQKLWVALSCPVKGLELDEKTLALIDTDKNGRIRVPEVLAAIEWCAARLKNLDDLTKPQSALPLALLNEETPEGKLLLGSSKHILQGLGKASATSISVEDTVDPQKIFSTTVFNGDGIITADVASDDATKNTILEIIALYGGETDRSGKPGINAAKTEQYFKDAAAHVAWVDAGTSAAVNAVGEKTAPALEAIRSIRAKVDDYFARCSLASFDQRALSALNRQESEYLVVASKDLTLGASEMSGFPLSRVEAGRPLSLTEGLNPAWAASMAQLRRDAIVPFFGADKITLSSEEWSALCQKIAPFEQWTNSRPVTPVASLPLARIREIATGAQREQILKWIQQDAAVAAESSAVGDVERLARYYRDLGTLLRNFVNFSDFYNPDTWATFQAGKLYFDSRSCDLCVHIDDPAAHSILASLSKCYLAYCDLKRGSETQKIVACFSQGDSDYLMAGRNGLFYDRKGKDWDATITKIVDFPISLRQAFWSPYKKFTRMIEEQVTKRAAAAETKADATLGLAAGAVANADKTKPAEPKKIDVGTVAALGVAVGAIGTAFGYFLGLFKGLAWWQFPLLIVGIMLAISLPSVAMAWIKLRHRTLGPILDATGWAVNARVKINIPFGTSLTQRARLPHGSIHTLRDPFADKAAARRRMWIILMIIFAVAAYGTYAYKTRHWPFKKEMPAPEKTPAPDNVQQKAG
ncbi:MAG TPA: hypothetical protein VFT72_11140 [Opitutaceae bacterium]|nr:hypothetical protein [Opitutaceae bacterium]